MNLVPSLSPLSDEAIRSDFVAVPPPLHFRPLRGTPRQVNLNSMSTPYVALRGDTAAKEAGLRYEAKVQRKLQEQFATYLPTPQLEFFDDGGWRVIRPDGVLTLLDRVVAFEIKIQHMPEAWWQLTKLYAPVLSIGCKRPCQVVEVVRSFDPAMPFQGPVEVISPELLKEWITRRDTISRFGVLLWKL